MKTRRPIFLTVTLIAALCASTASPASASAGTVTSTVITPPSVVSGSTLATAFNDGTGGSYQVYSSGQTRNMIRVLASGAVDTAFNAGNPVSIGIPAGLASSGAMRLSATTHAGTQNWWTVVTEQMPSNSNGSGLTITSGNVQGAVSVTKNIDSATVISKCAEHVSGTNSFQTAFLHPRRNGGVWLQVTCGTSMNVGFGQVLIPLTAAGEFDSTSRTVSARAAHGSSTSCSLLSSFIADPTSKVPAPELWFIRTEHNYQENSECVTGTAGGNTSTRISGIVAAHVALAALAVLPDGTVTRTQISTGSAQQPGGMRIDPGGRPVALVSDITDRTKIKAFRIKADGSLDTSVGTNGFRELDSGALPAGATSLSVGIGGIVTTADRTYFAITLSDGEVTSYANNTTPRVHGFRMGLASMTDGWATGFGTNGIGARVTTTLPENWFSSGRVVTAGSTVNAKGEPQNFMLGQTSTSLNIWGAISGATGGGEGGTGLGGFTRDTGGAPSAGNSGSATGRIDTKVYTRLPATVQVNTAFTVLSPTQTTTQSLMSRTSNTCVVSKSHVVVIATGVCTVTVSRKADKKVIRTLRTTVSKTISTLGSEVTISDPITFSIASARLSSAARTKTTEIATTAATAKAVVVVGHAAALTESRFNFAISQKRADAVRRALRRAGVAAPVTATARGTSQQISRKKTETAQAQNRRVVAYLIP
jgi:outer membrane protein OmpA-like peptidoglycan-associated protein